jgi:hypothetical protein
MKTKFLKLYMVALMLISNFVLFAQPGNSFEDETGNTDGNVEADAAPINGLVIYLGITALLLAFFWLRKKQKSTTN